ncbi:MAG: four helix bundle protein [Bacteroidetes bacterium]|nr:MAG: four helix bundle protein [Bacteroidota bacterium]
MFDFEKLDLYQHLKRLSVDILKFLATDKSIDEDQKQQFKDAVLKSLFLLAESTAKMKVPKKKDLLVASRSAIFESVAILQVIDGSCNVPPHTYEDFYDRLTTSSKMLLAMYRSYDR